MTFLEKLEQAVQQRKVSTCFTTDEVKRWIQNDNITNDITNQPYAPSTIEGVLSSSALGSTSTKTDKALYVFENPRRYSFNSNGC